MGNCTTPDGAPECAVKAFLRTRSKGCLMSRGARPESKTSGANFQRSPSAVRPGRSSRFFEQAFRSCHKIFLCLTSPHELPVYPFFSHIVLPDCDPVHLARAADLYAGRWLGL